MKRSWANKMPTPRPRNQPLKTIDLSRASIRPDSGEFILVDCITSAIYFRGTLEECRHLIGWD